MNDGMAIFLLLCQSSDCTSETVLYLYIPNRRPWAGISLWMPHFRPLWIYTFGDGIQSGLSMCRNSRSYCLAT